MLYAWCALAVGALLCAALLPAQLLPHARSLALEVIGGGVAGVVLTALLLAVSALLAALALTAARAGSDSPDHGRGATTAARVRRWITNPGIAARQVQALILAAGALWIVALTGALWPTTLTASDATAADIAGAFTFALAFVSLLAERLMNAFPAPQLPEAPALRRLLLVVTLTLTAAACIEFARAAGLEWVRWPEGVAACMPALVALELALRALARLFLPLPAREDARAVSDSILAGLIGGVRSPRTVLHTHFGLDFARSWALQFLSAALLPALVATGLLCWGLSGLKMIELGQRGIYERFGAPVAVLGPGLHLLLPWPLGRLRPVEYGTIHAVAIGVDQSAPQSEPELSAEAAPPVSLNRLWESSHADQADYLVPSPSTGQQGFQSVSTEIHVLYRVGLSDEAALQSVYAVADPESLIKQAASRLVLRYFNSRTLDAVLGARRENIAAMLRDELAADLDSRHAGIEIVSVLIEEMHPPAGAAVAYHAVQAAEINALASISDETRPRQARRGNRATGGARLDRGCHGASR